MTKEADKQFEGLEYNESVGVQRSRPDKQWVSPHRRSILLNFFFFFFLLKHFCGSSGWKGSDSDVQRNRQLLLNRLRWAWFKPSSSWNNLWSRNISGDTRASSFPASPGFYLLIQCRSFLPNIWRVSLNLIHFEFKLISNRSREFQTGANLDQMIRSAFTSAHALTDCPMCATLKCRFEFVILA